TLIKANRVEALSATSELTRPLAMARRLADEHACSVVVTYGGHGMVAAEREGGTWYLPAEATEIRDVCGAGDTLLASLAAMLYERKQLKEACIFASCAAANQVSSVGICQALY
ncbi:MAG: bifunctional hydroxymethylpyrimidine kinase/phosphomethylpyrimidine kinase, partial [Pirellulales bacterium]|nr:bifunctional hydroxymethylpyrimidine kinase/phosphomethylpyrimidine kinase [Pirellulales bacterium]